MRWLRSRKGRLDVLAAAIIVLVVILEWGLTYRVFQDQRLSDPVSYWGDAQFTAALVAAAARGEYWPFLSKEIPSLGAPFVANWNDFPMAEDWHFFLTGQLARVVGVFAAINLGYLLGCVSAALSFFFVARKLHQAREFAFMGALLYGLSMYAFARGVHHYTLVFFFVLPWTALVSSWMASRRGISFRSGRFAFAVFTFVMTGWSNPYYLFFALQVFGLSFLVHAARKGGWRQWGPAMALIATGMLAFASVNADTIAWQRAHGRNDGAVSRGANEGEYYALKPINFFIAGGNHHLAFMKTLSDRRNAASVVPGEAPAPYLGFAGIALLLSLLGYAVTSVGRRRMDYGVACALVVAWLTIGHAVGGENSLMSVAGFNLFRSVNRVSIMIFAWILLFAGWWLPRLLRRWSTRRRWALAGLVGVVGAWEPIPEVSDAKSVATDRARAQADRELVAKAEAALPAGAKVFQLPAMGFPEVPAYGAVDGYEMFRPYYFAKTLVFSHGDDKGRPNADWKTRVASMPPAQMAQELRNNGFSAVYINTKGYGGATQGLVDGFVGAGAQVIGVSSYQQDSLFLKL